MFFEIGVPKNFAQNKKTANPAKTCVQKILRTPKKNYVHEIAAVNLILF